ncbi:DNA mismatch repair protein MSH7 [Platanthera guangdongensis]|uniref:DNA mismatch repair protein MSH7 n=1 Tax=Platanthera guangdongensis TaxID=2320717 RepID=A0ABR2LI41_9ASPA
MAGIPKSVVEAASTAGDRMKLMICNNFNSSESRSDFSTLHEEWLKSILFLSRGCRQFWDEDASDTLLCLWHEMRSLHRALRLRKTGKARLVAAGAPDRNLILITLPRVALCVLAICDSAAAKRSIQRSAPLFVARSRSFFARSVALCIRRSSRFRAPRCSALGDFPIRPFFFARSVAPLNPFERRRSTTFLRSGGLRRPRIGSSVFFRRRVLLRGSRSVRFRRFVLTAAISSSFSAPSRAHNLERDRALSIKRTKEFSLAYGRRGCLFPPDL